MTDIAQILALPVPLRPTPPYPPAQYRGTVSDAADSTAQDGARARRFRFRVYQNDDSSTGNSPQRTNESARKQVAQSDIARPNAARSNATQVNAEGAGGADARASRRSGNQNAAAYQYLNTRTTSPSSAFLAQSIAQEHLGQGLYNPPFAAASAAYTRSGNALSYRASTGLDLSV
ncbi:MAG TPA: hypothetical protein VGM59_17835 [Dongiaceae bacterium]|jgi:hypothetical protein